MKTSINLTKTGYKYLKNQIDKLEGFNGNISKDSDIENLHKVRVAVRKSLGSILLLKPLLSKNLSNDLVDRFQSFLGELGKARDLDVHILFLTEYMDRLEKNNLKQGIKRFILRLNQKREKIDPHIQEVLLKFNKWLQKKDIAGIIKDQLKRNKTTEISLAKNISDKANRIVLYHSKVIFPENIEELHDLRKEIKHFRYTLDICIDRFDDMFS